MPANQSLILAGDPLPGVPTPYLDGGALKRVTIFEARSNTTLVVQADYYPQSESLSVVPRLDRAAQGSAYLKPLELYARTQRGIDDQPRAALLDVLA